MKRIDRVLVLGGGSAGLMAAVTLKRKLPALEVEVLRSPELGIIGVGEGTTAAFPRHFFEYLKQRLDGFGQHARRGLTVAEGLAQLRQHGVKSLASAPGALAGAKR